MMPDCIRATWPSKKTGSKPGSNCPPLLQNIAVVSVHVNAPLTEVKGAQPLPIINTISYKSILNFMIEFIFILY